MELLQNRYVQDNPVGWGPSLVENPCTVLKHFYCMNSNAYKRSTIIGNVVVWTRREHHVQEKKRYHQAHKYFNIIPTTLTTRRSIPQSTYQKRDNSGETL